MKLCAPKDWEEYQIAETSQNLVFTSRGKFLLEVEGQRDYMKWLTPKQAEEWLKEHYPSQSWKKCVKECEEWRSSEKGRIMEKVGVLPLK